MSPATPEAGQAGEMEGGAAGTAGGGTGGRGSGGRGGTDTAEAGEGGIRTGAAGGTDESGGAAGSANGGRGGSAGSGGVGGAMGGSAGVEAAGGSSGSSGGTAGEAGAFDSGGEGGITGTGGDMSTGGVGIGGVAGSAGTGGSSSICVAGERQICSVTPGNHGGCFESMRFCENDDWGVCRPIPGEMLPGGEACNREDDDCDGLIDEGLGAFDCGLGACRRSVNACSLGVLGVCIPGTPSGAADGCNGIDDDCDGAVDEDCTPCIKVAPTGNDTTATSDPTTPFATVQAAIDFADTHRHVSTRVCVAAGPACGATATFAGPNGADLTMRSGIDVLGQYESTDFSRCQNSVTRLAPQTPVGVSFPAAVSQPTHLDGFTIVRPVATTTAGVTSSGTGVVLSNLVIDDGPASVTSYGVNVIGGDATVVASRVTGGLGTSEAIGVRAAGGRVTLEDNCASPDPATGLCDDLCGNGRQISGRNGDGSGVSNAVRLDGAPGSRIERSTVCVIGGSVQRPLGALAAVRISGDGDGIVIRGNNVSAQTAGHTSRALAIATDGCAGKSPWIVGNHSIHAWNNLSFNYVVGGWADDIAAIHVYGDCHPAIDHNQNITGLANTNVSHAAYGSAIRNGATNGVASRAVIESSVVTGGGQGLSGSPTVSSVAVRCADGACAKVSRNQIVGRRGAYCSTPFCNHSITGLQLAGGATFVDSNMITPGCGSSGTALNTSDTSARIQNNSLYGFSQGYCGASENLQSMNGLPLRVGLVTGTNEVDIHSNTLVTDQGRPDIVANVPTTPIGILRNNVLYPSCTPSSGFRLVENNFCEDDDLDNVMSHAKDLGTSVGAPLWDQTGKLRDSLPDIGHREF